MMRVDTRLLLLSGLLLCCLLPLEARLRGGGAKQQNLDDLNLSDPAPPPPPRKEKAPSPQKQEVKAQPEPPSKQQHKEEQAGRHALEAEEEKKAAVKVGGRGRLPWCQVSVVGMRPEYRRLTNQ